MNNTICCIRLLENVRKFLFSKCSCFEAFSITFTLYIFERAEFLLLASNASYHHFHAYKEFSL